MKFLSLTLFTILLSSCASTEKDVKNPFDALTLKETLIEGQTTQAGVLSVFGAPDIVLEESKKGDVWVYSKQKTQTESSGGVFGAAAFLPGIIGIVGGAVDSESGSTSNKTITLSIEFNKKKILKSYQLSKIAI